MNTTVTRQVLSEMTHLMRKRGQKGAGMPCAILTHPDNWNARLDAEVRMNLGVSADVKRHVI